MKVYTFPSVIESHNTELRNVAPDLLNGIKIFDDETGYIVGQLALSEGTSPHKAINSSPQDLDYRLLLKSGLLLTATSVQSPIILTMGFPFSTFQINRGYVNKIVEDAQAITFDTAPYGGRSKQTRELSVLKVDVIPEVIGCIIGARKGDTKQQGAFFMCSMGYGTFEAALSTESGVVQRTMVSTNGIRYAVDLAMEELNQTYYLGLRTEHQFDTAFQRGSIVFNRRRVDFSDVRKRALRRYYSDVISPILRNRWTDEDFNRSGTLVIAGGGALYPEFMECFQEEFGDVVDIKIVGDPTTLAARGYYYRSKSLSSLNEGAAVGIDIGNAQTVIVIDDES